MVEYHCMPEPFVGPTTFEVERARSENECRAATLEFLKIRDEIARQVLAFQAKLAIRTPATLGLLLESPDGINVMNTRTFRTLNSYNIHSDASGLGDDYKSVTVVVIHEGEKVYPFLWLEKNHHPDDSIDGVLITPEGVAHDAAMDYRVGQIKDVPPKATLKISSLSVGDYEGHRFKLTPDTDPDDQERILFEEGPSLKILTIPRPSSSSFGYFYPPESVMISGRKPDPRLVSQPIWEVKDEDLATVRSMLNALTPK